MDYGDPKQPDAALKWLWRFVDGARTPGELYGRALVVIAAEQYAVRLVLPTSQRGHPTSWGSHKDLAAKALKKLAGPHVPASLIKLERAVKRAHDEHVKAERAHYEDELGRLQDVAEALGVELNEKELIFARERIGERLSREDAMEEQREDWVRSASRDQSSDASEIDAMFTRLAE